MSIVTIPDRLNKLGRLMLDKGATAGEADSAAVQFVRHARKSGVTFDNLFSSNELSLPPCAYLVLHFGKHRGESLAEVATDDPAYIFWLYDDATNLNKPLRLAVDAVAAWLLGKGVAA